MRCRNLCTLRKNKIYRKRNPSHIGMNMMIETEIILWAKGHFKIAVRHTSQTMYKVVAKETEMLTVVLI